MPNGSNHTDYDEVVRAYQRKPRPTLQAVADQFGVVRERIRQILNERGIETGVQQPTKQEVSRVMRAVRRAAETVLREQEHGSRRRYFGGEHAFGLPPCRCEACRKANRDTVYKSIGYTPKYGRAEYQTMLRELGGIPPRGTTIEQMLEQKRSSEDGSK